MNESECLAQRPRLKRLLADYRRQARAIRAARRATIEQYCIAGDATRATWRRRTGKGER